MYPFCSVDRQELYEKAPPRLVLTNFWQTAAMWVRVSVLGDGDSTAWPHVRDHIFMSCLCRLLALVQLSHGPSLLSQTATSMRRRRFSRFPSPSMHDLYCWHGLLAEAFLSCSSFGMF